MGTTDPRGARNDPVLHLPGLLLSPLAIGWALSALCRGEQRTHGGSYDNDNNDNDEGGDEEEEDGNDAKGGYHLNGTVIGQ